MALTGEAWEQIEALLPEALELAPAERLRFLDRHCPETLRSELEALIAAAASGDGVLDRPVTVTAAADPAPSLAHGAALGSWRIDTLLGSGGMGEVYAAERADGSYEQRVAIKLLKRGIDTQAVLSRFLRERRILARLSHPNIARLLDAGAAADGRPYLVMERVDGLPIDRWCERYELPLQRRLELMCTVCEAVYAAHREQIVHRDLKPSNVLVSEAGEVKLLDFGVSKLVGEDGGDKTQTVLGAAPLTLDYAAPEQLLGQAVTTATDVYALGLLLYRLLTGELPHARPSLAAALTAADKEDRMTRPSLMLRKRSDTDPKTRRTQARELDGDLDKIVLKALQREPTRRYASAAELADDLRRHLDGRPVLARPDSRWYVARKFVIRNWVPVSAAVGMVTALVIGLTVALWQARLATAQAQRAERVKEFMIDVFKATDPENSQSSTMSAREVLDQGVKQIRNQLATEPALQADMYDTLAQTYLNLGAGDRALELARTALAERRKQYAPGDTRVAESLLTLGKTLVDRSDFAAARAALSEAADIVSADGQGDSLLAARISGAFADSEEGAARSNEAVIAARRAYAIFLRQLGANAPETARQQIDLAELLEEAGQYTEAEQNYRAAIKAVDSSIGPESLAAGTAHLNFASMLDRTDQTEEAERELDRAIVILRKAVGDNHPKVGEALFSRALLYGGQHRFPEEEADLRQSLRIYPPGSYNAAQSQRYLGTCLTSEGRYAEAQEQLTAAVAIFRKSGPDEPQLYRAMADLATAQLRNGQAREAEPVLREAVKNLERLAGPESYEVRNPLKRLGEDLAALGRNEEAVAVLERVRALEIKLFGNDQHRDLASTDYLLAHALFALDTPQSLTQARPLAEQAVTLYRKHFPGGDLGRALLLRARLGLAAGDGSAAHTDLVEALEQLRQATPPDPADIALARKLLLDKA